MTAFQFWLYLRGMAPTATSPPVERTERAEALARLLRSVADMCRAEEPVEHDEALHLAVEDLRIGAGLLARRLLELS